MHDCTRMEPTNGYNHCATKPVHRRSVDNWSTTKAKASKGVLLNAQSNDDMNQGEQGEQRIQELTSLLQVCQLLPSTSIVINGKEE